MAWESKLIEGLTEMLQDEATVGKLPKEVKDRTPARLVKAYKECLVGIGDNPELVLAKSFPCKDGGMVIVDDIPVQSICQHHFLPFFGKAVFGYIPSNKIVGLSKIPRLVEIFSRRPQLQEQLGSQIVDVFMKVLKPLGCGLVMKATHTCMSHRGVRVNGVTTTVALRGVFRKNALAKQEFMAAIKL